MRNAARSFGTLLLGLVAAVLYGLNRIEFFPWLEGRTNGDVPGLPSAFLANGVWWLCVVSLLVAVAVALAKKRYQRCAIPVACLLLSASPWVLPVEDRDYEVEFVSGFGRWVVASGIIGPTRQWSAELSAGASPTTVPYWWPVEDIDTELGIPVPRDQWPEIVSDATPDDVRVIHTGEGRTVVLSWSPSHLVGWPRLVLVGAVGVPPPDLDTHISIWQQVEPDVSVGIRIHH